MKGKHIILVGTGAIFGFISCGVFTTKKILKNDKTREALIEIVCDKIECLLYDAEPRYRRYRRVDYCNYYGISYCDGIVRVYIFNRREDAEDLLDAMNDIIENYGFVSATDVCDLYGVAPDDYRLNEYGWTNIDGCKPIRTKEGYKICLPRPIRTNKFERRKKA